jgi:hypothetical protein
LIYLIDRYYDPATDQFLSVDPLVAETGQPYAFTGDDPVNETDPLGLVIPGGPGCPKKGCPSATPTLKSSYPSSTDQAVNDPIGAIFHPVHPGFIVNLTPAQVACDLSPSCQVAIYNAKIKEAAAERAEEETDPTGSISFLPILNVVSEVVTDVAGCVYGATWVGAAGTLLEPGGGTVVGIVVGCGVGGYAASKDLLPPSLPGPDGR